MSKKGKKKMKKKMSEASKIYRLLKLQYKTLREWQTPLEEWEEHLFKSWQDVWKYIVSCVMTGRCNLVPGFLTNSVSFTLTG